MFKVATIESPSDLLATKEIMRQVYEEDRSKWPYGLDADNFDGGLYLIREKQSNTPVGFCGWQIRNEFEPVKQSSTVRVGYYSIGILPEYRNNGFAKAAVSRLIAFKAASVDRVKAMIVAGNVPSLELARSLQVPVMLKAASFPRPVKEVSDFYACLLRVGARR